MQSSFIQRVGRYFRKSTNIQQGKIRFWSKYYVPIHTLFVFTLCTVIHYGTSSTTRNDASLRIPLQLNTTQWIDFFSCQVVHIDSYHLLNNMGIILLLGGILELIHGPIPSLAIFWIGGTTGMMLEAGWWSHTSTRLLGASSGAFALCAAYLSHLIINWKETPFRLAWFASFIICVMLTIILYCYTESVKYSIAHLAHIGGTLQGLFVGCLVVRNVKVLSIENAIKIFCFILASTFILSVWYRITLVHS